MADDDDDTELSVAVTDDISFPWEVATVLASQASSSELHAQLQMSVLVLVPYPSSSSSSTSSSSLSAPHSPLGQQRSRARGEHYRQYTSDELEAAVAQHMKEGGTGAGAAERKDGPSWVPPLLYSMSRGRHCSGTLKLQFPVVAFLHLGAGQLSLTMMRERSLRGFAISSL